MKSQWLYLFSSCIFLLLIIVSYPIAKSNLSGSNLYVMIAFLAGFILSFFLFIKGIFRANKIEKKEEQFVPIID